MGVPDRWTEFYWDMEMRRLDEIYLTVLHSTFKTTMDLTTFVRLTLRHHHSRSLVLMNALEGGTLEETTYRYVGLGIVPS